jgi:hypothetical protein
MKSASWERSKRTTTWTWKLSWRFPCGNALSSLRLLSCPRYACTHARTHKHARTHTHAHTLIHIHIHMHTHTHTQTHDVSTVLTSRLQLFRSLLSGALALSSAPPTWTVPPNYPPSHSFNPPPPSFQRTRTPRVFRSFLGSPFWRLASYLPSRPPTLTSSSAPPCPSCSFSTSTKSSSRPAAR